MILIVGGAASGKLEHVRSLGYDASQIDDGTLGDAPVLINLQKIIFASDVPSDERFLADLLRVLSTKDVVACDEVGSGIIPISTLERERREATGRLCIRLAREASAVFRVVAGISTRIK